MIQMFVRESGTDFPFWAYLPVSLEFVFLASVSVLLFKRLGSVRSGQSGLFA